MDWQEAIYRLREIQEEIGALVYEAKDIIKEVAPGEYERARRYWGSHIEGALSDSYGWLSGSIINMDSTIASIERELRPNNEE